MFQTILHVGLHFLLFACCFADWDDECCPNYYRLARYSLPQEDGIGIISVSFVNKNKNRTTAVRAIVVLKISEFEVKCAGRINHRASLFHHVSILGLAESRSVL